ncbi:hypothetical protein KI387_002803, partial [Taxus chinensis]
VVEERDKVLVEMSCLFILESLFRLACAWCGFQSHEELKKGGKEVVLVFVAAGPQTAMEGLWVLSQTMIIFPLKLMALTSSFLEMELDLCKTLLKIWAMVDLSATVLLIARKLVLAIQVSLLQRSRVEDCFFFRRGVPRVLC